MYEVAVVHGGGRERLCGRGRKLRTGFQGQVYAKKKKELPNQSNAIKCSGVPSAEL